MQIRKIAVCLLLLSLLLVSCGGERRFTRDEDGYGYTDAKSGVHYAMLDVAFEPAAGGEVVGYYQNGKNGTVRNFREIVGLDPAQYLTDDYRHVYYSGGDAVDPAAWEVATIFTCMEGSFGVEMSRVADAAGVAAVRGAWFSGAGDGVLPAGGAKVSRRVKFAFVDHPALYYAVSFAIYEGGDAYLYDLVAGRVVPLSPEVTALLYREAEA